MQIGELLVRPTRHGYAVFRGDQKLSRSYSCEYTAHGAATRIEAQSRRKLRPCICCGEIFASSGPGHRMCTICRGDTYRAMDRYENRPSEPDDLGRSDGRIARRQTIGYISIG